MQRSRVVNVQLRGDEGTVAGTAVPEGCTHTCTITVSAAGLRHSFAVARSYAVDYMNTFGVDILRRSECSLPTP